MTDSEAQRERTNPFKSHLFMLRVHQLLQGSGPLETHALRTHAHTTQPASTARNETIRCDSILEQHWRWRPTSRSCSPPACRASPASHTVTETSDVSSSTRHATVHSDVSSSTRHATVHSDVSCSTHHATVHGKQMSANECKGVRRGAWRDA